MTEAERQESPDVFFGSLFESSHLFVIHSVSPFTTKKEKLHVVSTSFLPSVLCSSSTIFQNSATRLINSNF